MPRETLCGRSLAGESELVGRPLTTTLMAGQNFWSCPCLWVAKINALDDFPARSLVTEKSAATASVRLPANPNMLGNYLPF